jgi:hypothetical protein
MSGGMMKDQSGTMHHDKMGEHHGMMEHGQMMSGMMGNVEPDDRDDGKDVRHDERHAGRQHEEDVRHNERNVASDAGYVHDDGQWKVHSSRDEEDAGSNDGDTERNVWDGNAEIAGDERFMKRMNEIRGLLTPRPPPEGIRSLLGKNGGEVRKRFRVKNILGETEGERAMAELHLFEYVSPLLHPDGAFIVHWRQAHFGLWCQYAEIEKDISDPTIKFWLR